MAASASALEKPLPKPGRDLSGYAAARALEALLEAIIALEFLGRGYTRNAAGKAFQAWRALTGALLALGMDRITERLQSKEQRRWLKQNGVHRIPSSKLKPLARLVEETGVPDYGFYTAVALLLHDYQYHGPDPAGEAARDILQLLAKLTGIIEEHVKPKLREAGKWTGEHEEALQRLRQKLGTANTRT